MKILRFIIPLFLASATLRAEPKVVAYVPNWIDLKTFVPQIDYAKLTHINIAFENPTGADGALSFHEENDLLIRQAHEHGVKILISLGGGSASENKSVRECWFDLISNSNRTRFVTRLAEYTRTHNLEGLDIDLEGPAINHDYGAFIQELSAALKQTNKLLTAALSKGYGGNDVPAAALACFNFINVMAYDATGPWQPKKPGPHSSLEFAQANVDYWLQRGLPKAKLVLGVPFYGWGFGKAFRESEYRYADLARTYPEAAHTDQVGDTIWHNSIPTMQAKAKLVREQSLGGIMIWSLNADASGKESLLSALDAALQK